VNALKKATGRQEVEPGRFPDNSCEKKKRERERERERVKLRLKGKQNCTPVIQQLATHSAALMKNDSIARK